MKKTYWIFALISTCVIAADQATKWMVMRCIPWNDGINVLPGLVNLVHVRNPGAAFGIMSQNTGYLRWFFLVAVAVAALLILLCLIVRATRLDGYLLTAYALFFAGAAGNLIDRLRYGEVIDFIDVYVGKYHWPAFNVADSVLCAGVGLLLVHSLRGGFRETGA